MNILVVCSGVYGEALVAKAILEIMMPEHQIEARVVGESHLHPMLKKETESVGLKVEDEAIELDQEDFYWADIVLTLDHETAIEACHYELAYEEQIKMYTYLLDNMDIATVPPREYSDFREILWDIEDASLLLWNELKRN